MTRGEKEKIMICFLLHARRVPSEANYSMCCQTSLSLLIRQPIERANRFMFRLRYYSDDVQVSNKGHRKSEMLSKLFIYSFIFFRFR